MNKSLYSVRGFTLVEMIVVISIIVLLTGIILTNLNPSKQRARDSKRLSDVGQLQVALELYFDRCNQYPASVSSSGTNIIDITSSCPVTGGGTAVMGSYISNIPTPPAGASGCLGNPCQYDYSVLTQNSSNVNYVLHANTETYSDVMKDGINAMPPAGTGTWSTTFADCNNAAGTNVYCVASR